MPAGYSVLPMYIHHCLLPSSTLVQLHRVYMISNIMVNILICMCIKCRKCRDRMVRELEEGIGARSGYCLSFVSQRTIRARIVK